MGNAQVADAPGGLPLLECLELGVDIHQVVDLHEVHCPGFQLGHAAFHLIDSGLPALGPDLGGQEKTVMHLELGRQVSDHFFGLPIHRRRVHHLAAHLHEGLEDLFEGRPYFGGGSHVEGPCGAEADYRQRLPGRGDFPGMGIN
jgi:hypothetical protein